MEEETEESEQGKSKTGTSVNGENEKEEIVTCKALETQKITARPTKTSHENINSRYVNLFAIIQNR